MSKGTKTIAECLRGDPTPSPSKKIGLHLGIDVGLTYENTRELLERGLSVEPIAKARGLRASRIVRHLEHLIKAGLDIDLGSMLPAPERVEKIRMAIEETGGTSLWSAKEMIGGEYYYHEIRMVWLFLRKQVEVPK